MKIRKGDNVVVVAGKDKGKSGTVLQVLPRARKIVVQGAQTMKRHQRPRRQGEKGQVLTKEAPMDISNVMLVCPRCSKPTRVGFRDDASEKSRICKKCEASI